MDCRGRSLLDTVIAVVVLLVLVAVGISQAMAGGDHQTVRTEYVYLSKDDESAKYVLGGAVLVGAFWCVVEKCWEKIPEVTQGDTMRVTPDNLADKN